MNNNTDKNKTMDYPNYLDNTNSNVIIGKVDPDTLEFVIIYPNKV